MHRHHNCRCPTTVIHAAKCRAYRAPGWHNFPSLLAAALNAIYPTALPVEDKIKLADDTEQRLIAACRILPIEQSDALNDRLVNLLEKAEKIEKENQALRREKGNWTRANHSDSSELERTSMELIVSQLRLLEFYEKEADDPSINTLRLSLEKASDRYARLGLFDAAGFRWKGIGDALLNSREDGRLTTFEVTYLVGLAVVPGLNAAEVRRVLDRTRSNGKPKCILHCGDRRHSEGCRNTDVVAPTEVKWRFPRPALR